MDSKSSSSKENLLQDYIEDGEPDIPRRQSLTKWLSRSWYLIIGVSIIFISTIINAYLFFENRSLQDTQYLGRSRFTGLGYDTPVAYHTRTEWWGDNHTRADELWDGIDISPLTVALTDEWALDHDLTVSESRFPWDKQKGLYYLKVFHQLHCLKIMRKAWRDIELGNPQTLNPNHIYHCLDTLRQDVVCKADDTPMPTILKPDVIGNNQVMQCRNIDKVVEWTQQPDQQSCYRRLTDYVKLEHKLERFAFCPKESKYYPVMSSYFEKWGHKDPFVA